MIIIPIGPDCGVSLELERISCKNESFTFDWLLSHNFDDISKVIMMGDKIDVESNSKIKGTDIYDPGHYINKDLSSIIIRRNDRLLNCIKSQSNILFIRNESENINKVILLRDTILNINPDCKFNILIYGTEVEHKDYPNIFYRKSSLSDILPKFGFSVVNREFTPDKIEFN